MQLDFGTGDQTMSKEKQIEEMWNIITTDCDNECVGCEFENDNWCFTHRVINDLYNAGYRKQSDYREELIEAFDNYISEMTVSKWGTKSECETARTAVRMAVAFVLGELPKMKGGAEE